MKKRLLSIGLLVVVSQLCGTGCFRHHPIIDHWRSHHPCAPSCAPCGPCSSSHRPILPRNMVVGEPIGPTVAGAPCHGCGPTGTTVGLNSGGDLVPITHPPTIGYPTPIVPGGPTVIPSYELPRPMQVPKGNGQ